MKIVQLTKQILITSFFACTLISCKKDKASDIDPIGDRGQTIVKILDGGMPGHKSFALDFINTPANILAADIRRDVSNQQDLNSPMTVTLLDDTAAVSASGLTNLDPSFYELAAGIIKTGGVGGTYRIEFAAGEFAKTINITIPNPTLLDPSIRYGLGFTIITTTAGNITVNKTLVIEIGSKNIYDGVYRVTGFFTHPTTDYVGPFGTPGRGEPLEIALVTTGAHTVKREAVSPASVAGFDGFIFWITSGATLTGFGNVFPEYDIDPATNVVSVFSNNPANSVVWMDYNSTYDPATRNFVMDYGYNTSTRRMQETWTYLRPR